MFSAAPVREVSEFEVVDIGVLVVKISVISLDDVVCLKVELRFFSFTLKLCEVRLLFCVVLLCGVLLMSVNMGQCDLVLLSEGLCVVGVSVVDVVVLMGLMVVSILRECFFVFF